MKGSGPGKVSRSFCFGFFLNNFKLQGLEGLGFKVQGLGLGFWAQGGCQGFSGLGPLNSRQSAGRVSGLGFFVEGQQSYKQHD